MLLHNVPAFLQKQALCHHPSKSERQDSGVLLADRQYRGRVRVWATTKRRCDSGNLNSVLSLNVRSDTKLIFRPSAGKSGRQDA